MKLTFVALFLLTIVSCKGENKRGKFDMDCKLVKLHNERGQQLAKYSLRCENKEVVCYDRRGLWCYKKENKNETND